MIILILDGRLLFRRLLHLEISIEKSLFPHGNEAAFLLLEALDRFSDGIVYQASFRRRNDKLALLEPVGVEWLCSDPSSRRDRLYRTEI